MQANSSSLGEAERFWQRATEMRRRAESVADERIRFGIIKIAETYEALADLEDEICIRMEEAKAAMRVYTTAELLKL